MAAGATVGDGCAAGPAGVIAGDAFAAADAKRLAGGQACQSVPAAPSLAFVSKRGERKPWRGRPGASPFRSGPFPIGGWRNRDPHCDQAAFEAIARSLPFGPRARAGQEGKERQPWFAVGFF